MLSYSAQLLLLLLLPLHNIIMMLLNRQAQGGEAGRQGTRLKGSSHTACAHCASTIKPHFTLMIRQTDRQRDRRNGALAWELRFATISAPNCRALGAWANNGVERGKGYCLAKLDHHADLHILGATGAAPSDRSNKKIRKGNKHQVAQVDNFFWILYVSCSILVRVVRFC